MKSLSKNFLFIFFIVSFFIFISFFRAGKRNFHSEDLNHLFVKNNKIIYFWATWCSVCQTNLGMIKFYEKHFNSKFNSEFISIEEGSNGDKYLQDYISKNEIEFKVLKATPGLLRKNFIESYPTTLFINSENKIIFSEIGIITPLGIFFRLLLLNIGL